MFRRERPSARRAYELLYEGYTDAADVPALTPDSYEERVAFERDHLSYQILDNVKRCMKDLAWDNKKLAAELGVTEGRVSQILSGEQNLTLNTLASLAAALKKHFHIRFSESVNPPWENHPASPGHPEEEVASPRTAQYAGHGGG